jgi:hypothetical protein
MEDKDDHGWLTFRCWKRYGNQHNQHKPDIATARNIIKDNIASTTTFFSTNFPERYGAKGIFNAFHNYGEVQEVVIPVKRDLGGRRFGFARFDQVTDIRKLKKYLDSVVFRGEKISVNISRFQRLEGKDEDEGRRGRSSTIQPQNRRSRTKSTHGTHSFRNLNLGEHARQSYTHAVRKGEGPKNGDLHQKVVLSYEAEASEMGRFHKAFTGVVIDPGSTYNIQNAFHSQGYFGEKVTPLGSN